MADTSLVFDILGRDGVSRVFAKIRVEAAATAAEMDTLGKKNGVLSGLGNSALHLGSAFSTTALNMAKIATVSNGVVTAANGIAALTGVVGLLPAAGFAAVGAIAALKLGADGAKQAFSQLTPTVNAMKTAVSGAFEKSLVPAVNNLKVILPSLTDGFKSVATAIGEAATDATSFIKTPQAIGQLQAVLGGTTALVHNLGMAIGPVIAAFLRIGSVAMPMLVDLTAGVSSVADTFNDWVQNLASSGKLQQWIQGGIDAFRSLGDILSNVFGIIADVFSVLQSTGTNLGGIIGSMIGTIRDFLETANGHAVLVSLATAIQTVGTVVGQVLGAALQAVGPLLPPLVTAFSQLVSTIGAALMPVIQQLAPVLMQIVMAILPLVPVFGQLIAAILPLVPPVAQLIATLVTGLVPILITIVTALIPVITTIVQLATTIIGVAMPAITFILGILGQLVGFIMGLVVGAFNFLVGIVMSVFDAIVASINGGVDIVRGILNWFGGLPAMFSGWWNSAVDAVSGAIGGMIGWVEGIPGRILGALGNLGGLLWGAGKAIIDGFLHGLQAAWGAVTNFVGGIASWIAAHKGPISFDARLLIPAGNAIMGGLFDGLDSQMPELQKRVNGINTKLGLTGSTSVIGTASPNSAPQGAAGRGNAVTLEINSSGSRLDDFMVELLRKAVRVRGGNVQVVLGK